MGDISNIGFTTRSPEQHHEDTSFQVEPDSISTDCQCVRRCSSQKTRRKVGFMTLERKITVGVSMALLVCSLVAFGQETTAGIQGTVKDPSGAVIPGVNVEVTSPALIGKKSAVTDAGGYYRIEQLPPGVYNIILNASGFGPQSQSVLKLSTGPL